MKHKRHGDINLHPVKQMKGKIVKHNGTFILARGEATGSVHQLKVKNPANLIIKQDKNGLYLELKEDGILTHTSDHEPLTIPAGIYHQVNEREIDHFSDSIEHKVID